jgi:VIT1/CCC1 family predicted Fe2+/Mn2+ transporter
MDDLHTESSAGVSGRLNWLRAAVLGAQDGVVSVSSIIVGVAGASDSRAFILTAGAAGLIAGALSMAAGEYVSVSTQRDTEKALLEKEREELKTQPEEELEELTRIYESKGLSRETAHKVAEELTAHDAFAAHVEAELKIDQHELANPWEAAFASAASFFAGAIIPLVVVMFAPADFRITAMLVAVFFVLIISGFLSAHAGGADKFKAILRVLAGGAVAMAITFAGGKFFGGLGI